MTPGRITTLYVSAAVLALSGIALRLVPPQVPVLALPPPTLAANPPRVDPAAQAAALLTYAAITEADVFAPDRRPTVRARRPATTPAAGDHRAVAMRLFGVASGAAGAVALIDADPVIPGAEIYRLGDRIAGYTITTIADTLVVLDGAAGRRVLTLQQTARRLP